MGLAGVVIDRVIAAGQRDIRLGEDATPTVLFIRPQCKVQLRLGLTLALVALGAVLVEDRLDVFNIAQRLDAPRRRGDLVGRPVGQSTQSWVK